MIQLGVDTLCWHLRLESGDITLEQVLEEAAGLGAACVQVNLHHARERDLDGLRRLRELAEGRGLLLLASGDFLGVGDLGCGRSVIGGTVGDFFVDHSTDAVEVPGADAAAAPVIQKSQT